MPARAKSARPALIVDWRDIRMFVHGPFGRRGRRRAEHYSQPGVAERIHRPIEPTPLKFAAARLIAGPSKCARIGCPTRAYAAHPRPTNLPASVQGSSKRLTSAIQCALGRPSLPRDTRQGARVKSQTRIAIGLLPSNYFATIGIDKFCRYRFVPDRPPSGEEKP